jgi:uncharacterized protein (TIGR02246 family)
MSTETEGAIAGLLERYKTAIFTKDLEGFLALFDQDTVIFDLWAKWSYAGIDSWRPVVADWFGSLNSERDVVAFDDVKTVVAGDVAMVHAFIRFTATSAEGKALRSMQERLTWTLIRKQGSWKIAHQHTSAPIDADTLKVILQR